MENIVGMTHEELVQKAIAVSGLPNRKNRHGYSARQWLAIKLDVHPSTISKWGRSSPVPKWAIEEISRLEREKIDIRTREDNARA